MDTEHGEGNDFYHRFTQMNTDGSVCKRPPSGVHSAGGEPGETSRSDHRFTQMGLRTATAQVIAFPRVFAYRQYGERRFNHRPRVRDRDRIDHIEKQGVCTRPTWGQGNLTTKNAEITEKSTDAMGTSQAQVRIGRGCPPSLKAMAGALHKVLKISKAETVAVRCRGF
ncbi:MAG: hypothetical protein JWR26_60 [Pedosphaera sp.]|nr:hypothetical protein [Pedosphaera sp.]